VDIGHQCQKWKSSILGVATVVLRDVFLASFFLAYVEPIFFFAFAWENSPVQPLPMASMIFQAFGVPTPAIASQLSTIQRMCFYLHTGYGDSKEYAGGDQMTQMIQSGL
jgi:hypothetical protein